MTDLPLTCTITTKEHEEQGTLDAPTSVPAGAASTWRFVGDVDPAYHRR